MDKPRSPWGLRVTRGCRRRWVRPSPGVAGAHGQREGLQVPWLRERGRRPRRSSQTMGEEESIRLQVCGLGASGCTARAEINNDISGVDVQTSSPTHRHKSETPDSIGRSRQPAAHQTLITCRHPASCTTYSRQTGPWSHHQHVLTHAHTLVFPKVL